MSKKRSLHALREKGRLDQIEAKISEELEATENDVTNGGYLSHYDASLINKGVVRTPKVESDDK